jgi:hypothetical protein
MGRIKRSPALSLTTFTNRNRPNWSSKLYRNPTKFTTHIEKKTTLFRSKTTAEQHFVVERPENL